MTGQLNARPDEVLHAEYKVKAQKYDELDTKYVRLLEEHSDLERQQAQWMLTTSQLETEREKCLIAEKRREALQAQSRNMSRRLIASEACMNSLRNWQEDWSLLKLHIC